MPLTKGQIAALKAIAAVRDPESNVAGSVPLNRDHQGGQSIIATFFWARNSCRCDQKRRCQAGTWQRTSALLRTNYRKAVNGGSRPTGGTLGA
jgi:hypothetical protein